MTKEVIEIEGFTKLKSGLREWAGAMLDTGSKSQRTDTFLSGLSIPHQIGENIYIRISIHCNKKWPCYPYHTCTPPLCESIEKHWHQPIREQLSNYKKALEVIRGASDPQIWQALDAFMQTCSLIQHLFAKAASQKRETRDIVRREQEGRCIVPSCNKFRSLHLHACLPVFRGGEYTPENCVLVCAQHHPMLEGCNNKAEVIENAIKATSVLRGTMTVIA